MKLKHLCLFGLLMCLFPASAQKVTYTKGEPIQLNQEEYLRYIGQNPENVLYELISPDKDLNGLVLVDIKTLAVKAKVRLSDLGISGMSLDSRVMGTTCYLADVVMTDKKGNVIKGATIEGFVIDISAGIKKKSHEVLFEFKGATWPYWWYDKDKGQFRLSMGSEVNYYDLSFRKVKGAASTGLEDPMQVVPKSRVAKFDFNNPYINQKAEREMLFYRLDPKDNDRVYVSTIFNPDENAHLLKGGMQEIVLIRYDSVSNTKKGECSLLVKDSALFLDFNCMVMDDGRYLVFGVYQDHFEDSLIQLGWFSAIVSRDLKLVNKIHYKPLVSGIGMMVMLTPGYGLVSDGFQIAGFAPSVLRTKDEYVLTRLQYLVPDCKMEMIYVNKATGVIRSEGMYNKYFVMEGQTNLSGYMICPLSDTTALILFNENRMNMEKHTSDFNLLMCSPNPLQARSAYTMYSTGRGFIGRQLVFSYENEVYFLKYSQAERIGETTGSNIEIIAPAYNKYGDSCVFYKLKVTL